MTLRKPRAASRALASFGAAAIGILATLAVASCAFAPLEEDLATARETAEALIAKQAPALPTRPLVAVHDAPYLAADRIAYAGVSWMQEPVVIRASELPFNLCLSKALEQLSQPPSVVFAGALPASEVAVTLDHDGTFREFLDLLADASGFGWEEKAGALTWMAEITRTFEIHRVPGEITYSMNTVQADNTQIIQAGGSGSGSGVRATPDAGGNISLIVSEDFWATLSTTLRRILGEDSEPIIDRATGTVVVRGNAARVREAGRHIAALNAWLARQVLLEVQLVTVTLNDNRSTGIDWQLVRNAASANPVGSSDLATASARALGLGLSPGSVGIRFGQGNALAGTSLILQALESQGETSVRTAPRLVALNGQAAQLQVLNDRGILAEVEVTTRGEFSTATQEQLRPGTVSTGVSLTILPKIVGDRIFLHANVLVSDLVALGTAGRADGQTIQLPTVDRSQFFQSARLRSGETLALGGIITDRGSANDQTIARFSWLGGKRRQYSRMETVLLITPTLLDPPAPDPAAP